MSNENFLVCETNIRLLSWLRMPRKHSQTPTNERADMSPSSRARHLLTLAVCTAVAATGSARAWAGNQTHPFVMTAYASAPGGHALLAQRYPAALQQLREYGTGALDPAAVNINSCVAYAMTRQWHAAHSACDAAVRAATNPHAFTAPWVELSGISTQRRLAAAYSDRAVMRWLTDDPAGARADLAKARALEPEAGFVTGNEAALAAHATATDAN